MRNAGIQVASSAIAAEEKKLSNKNVRPVRLRARKIPWISLITSFVLYSIYGAIMAIILSPLWVVALALAFVSVLSLALALAWEAAWSWALALALAFPAFLTNSAIAKLQTIM